VGWLSWEAWLSLATAVKIGNIANVVFVLSLIIGVISTVAIVGTTNVKEWYWDKDRKEFTERILELKADNLALETQIQPRNLDPDKRQEIGASLASFAGRQVSLRAYPVDGEARRLLAQIAQAFALANIKGEPFFPLEAGSVPLRIGIQIFQSPFDPFGKSVAEALSNAGIKDVVLYPDVQMGTSLVIWVGVKPL
jgi:hypothetical protein